MINRIIIDGPNDPRKIKQPAGTRALRQNTPYLTSVLLQPGLLRDIESDFPLPP